MGRILLRRRQEVLMKVEWNGPSVQSIEREHKKQTEQGCLANRPKERLNRVRSSPGARDRRKKRKKKKKELK
jgi:hypothetical protein